MDAGKSRLSCYTGARMARALRVWRLNAGWSQEQLAERAGVNPSTILRIERGHAHRPYPATRKRIADALGVAVDAIAEFAADTSEDG